MAKKKLLMIVGAGASIEFGMPSVLDAGRIIDDAANSSFPLAARNRASNIYRHIDEIIRRYWKRCIAAHLYTDPNFEDVLYAIFSLAAAYPAGTYTSAVGGLIQAKGLPDVIFHGHQTKIDGNSLHHLASICIDALLSELRDRCKEVVLSKALV